MFWQIINKEFSKEQKIGAGLFAIFVLLGFGMTVYGMYTNLSRPIKLKEARALQAVEKLRKDFLNAEFSPDVLRDTDADGLTDKDELNNYRTSPYLDDSDSDGIKDGDEIRAGKNPNCPEGKECQDLEGAGVTGISGPENTFFQDPLQDLIPALTQLLAEQQSATPGSGASPGLAPAGLQSGAGGTGAPIDSPLADFLKSLKDKPVEMRDFLLRSGVPAEKLDGLTNEEMVELFNKTLENFGIK